MFYEMNMNHDIFCIWVKRSISKAPDKGTNTNIYYHMYHFESYKKMKMKILLKTLIYHPCDTSRTNGKSFGIE